MAVLRTVSTSIFLDFQGFFDYFSAVAPVGYRHNNQMITLTTGFVAWRSGYSLNIAKALWARSVIYLRWRIAAAAS